MKTKYVTKKTILKAIEEEPLQGGNFVKHVYRKSYVLHLGAFVPSKDKNCEVCAVGAVLRKIGFSNNKIEKFGDKLLRNGIVSPAFTEDSCPVESLKIVNETVKTQLKEKQYLHALSVFFEYLAERKGTGWYARKVLSNFVIKNFPNRIKLDPKF